MYSKEIGFKVFAVVILQTAFWFVTICTTVGGYQRFRGTYPSCNGSEKKHFSHIFCSHSLLAWTGFCLLFPTVGYYFFATCIYNLTHLSCLEQTDMFGGNALDLYSIGTWFESCPGHRLSSLTFIMAFFSPSREILRYYLKQATSASFKILSSSSVITFVMYLDIESIIK
jgi:hypothetical protein